MARPIWGGSLESTFGFQKFKRMTVMALATRMEWINLWAWVALMALIARNVTNSLNMHRG